MTKHAFEGIKVADFGWFFAGPMTALYLAAHGATVVLAEGTIDKTNLTRTGAPFKDDIPGVNRSGLFSLTEGNRYSISLNLSHPKARDVATRLVAWADVVLDNFRPGTMAAWGLSYDEICKVNPSVIMIELSNLGQSGPLAKHPGVGTQLVSSSGFTNLVGWPDRMPSGLYGPYTDAIAPRFAASALIAALIHRSKTDEGQYLDLSELEASLQFLAPILLDYTVNGREPARQGNRHPSAAPHNAYPCLGDDRWCAITVFSDQEWQILCRVIGKPSLASDPRFTTLRARKENEAELDVILGGWTLCHTPEDVMKVLQENGIAAGVVQNGEDIHRDPQLEYREHFRILDHPEIGPHRYDMVSFRLSETPGQIECSAPCMGEHTEYVCKEFLDMSDEELISLFSAGVFG